MEAIVPILIVLFVVGTGFFFAASHVETVKLQYHTRFFNNGFLCALGSGLGGAVFLVSMIDSALPAWSSWLGVAVFFGSAWLSYVSNRNEMPADTALGFTALQVLATLAGVVLVFMKILVEAAGRR